MTAVEMFNTLGYRLIISKPFHVLYENKYGFHVEFMERNYKWVVRVEDENNIAINIDDDLLNAVIKQYEELCAN